MHFHIFFSKGVVHFHDILQFLISDSSNSVTLLFVDARYSATLSAAMTSHHDTAAMRLPMQWSINQFDLFHTALNPSGIDQTLERYLTAERMCSIHSSS